MKKFLVFFTLISLFVFGKVGLNCAFALDNNSYSSEEDLIFKIDSLCEGNDLFNNLREISELSSGLSISEKEAIFETQSVNRLPAFLCNYFLGFGIGSFIQGDYEAGNKALIADIIGGSLCIGGILLLSTDILNSFILIGSAIFQTPVNVFPEGLDMTLEVIMLSVGGCIILGSRIYQCIRPWSYGNSRNAALKNALGITPYVNPVNGSYGVSASISL